MFTVTITDCNGCTTTACDTVTIGLTGGCTDTTASNYSPQANFDDGSCTWDCNAFAISVDSVSNVTGCYGDRNGFINTSLNMSGTALGLIMVHLF